MQAGISTASLFLRRNNEDALPLMDGWGVTTAEVFLTSFSEYGKEFGKTLNKVKGNLDLFSAHVLNTQFEPQLFAKHPRVREDAYRWLYTALEGMSVFGCKNYTFHGMARLKKGARSGARDDFSSLIENMQIICAAAAEYGVTVCLENVEWSTYNRLGVFSRIAKETPALKGVLDVKQARLSGVAYEDYLTEMGEKISHVHISDLTVDGKMCLPGKGDFDFSLLVDRLKDVGFDGPLLIEAYAGDFSREEELNEAYLYISELLYKKNCLQKG